MRLLPLIRFLGLRYRLFWAQVRSRKGKAALLTLGILLAGLIAAFLGLGGLGAAVAAVRLGKSELVARFVLSVSFTFALFGSLLFSAGIDPAFSDAALRRYPVSSLERLAARHLVGIFEPLWIWVFVLDCGLVAGFAALGVSA